jgi:hypothetical protein
MVYKVIVSLLLIHYITAYPLFEYQTVIDDYDDDDESNLPCYDVRDYYTSAFIINHSIIYSSNISEANAMTSAKVSEKVSEKIKNIQKFNLLEKEKEKDKAKTIKTIYTIQNNITFHGLVVLEYKTLPHCSYTCDMLVIENQKSSIFISTYFNKYFKIGGTLHMICNNTACTWGKLVCNANKIRDEL